MRIKEQPYDAKILARASLKRILSSSAEGVGTDDHHDKVEPAYD